jgi:hypothetical protein
MGWLFVGVNSSILSYFAAGFFAQLYLRRYKPEWFVKWNYLTSAALDGGTQVLVFILSFAVFGGSGTGECWALLPLLGRMPRLTQSSTQLPYLGR